nr:PREDICTED: titin-like isoform X2 [Bemisia tabaci]
MHYRSTLLGIFSVAVFIQNVNAGLWGRSSDPAPEPPRRRKNLTCVLFFGNGACAFKCRLFGQGAEGYCDNLLCTCKYNDVIYVEGDNGFEPVPNSLAGRNTFIEPGRETPAPYEDEDADDLTPEENELKIKLITMMTFSPKHGSELCQFLRENNIDIDDVKNLSGKERKLNGGISYQPVTSRSLQSGTDILTQGNSIATRVLQSLPESCERPLRGGHFPAPRKSNRSNGGTPPRRDLKHHPRRHIEDDDEDDDDADDKLSSNLRSKHLPTHHDPHGNSHSPNRRQFTLNADTMRTPSLKVTTPKHKNVKNKSPPKIRKVPERPGRFSFTHPLKRSTDLQLNHVNPQKPELKDSPITPLPKYTVQPAVAEILPAAPSKDPVAENLKTVAPSESTAPNPQVTSRGKEEDAAPKIAKPMPMRRRRRKRRVTPSVPTPSKLPLKEQDPDKKTSEKSNAEEVLKPQPQEEGAPQTSPEQNSDKSPEIVNLEELPTSKIGIENQSASDSPEKPDVKTNETQERTDDRPNQLYVDNSSAPENPVPKPEATEPVLKSVTPIRNRLEQNPRKPLTVQMKPPSNHQTMELFDGNDTAPNPEVTEPVLKSVNPMRNRLEQNLQKPLTVQMKPPSNHQTMDLFDGNDTAPKPEATEPVLKSVTPMRNRLEQNPQKPLTVQMKPPSNHQTIELFDSNKPEVDSDPSNEMMPQDAANNQTTMNPPDTQPVVPSSWAWPWPWFKEPPVKTSEDLPETSPSSDAEPQSQEKIPDPVPEKDSERSDEKKPNQEEISQPLIGSPNTEDNPGDQKQQEPLKEEANNEHSVPVEEETEGNPSSQQGETFATPRESSLVSEHQPESNHEVVDTPAEKKASDSDFQSATPDESSLAHNSQEPSSSSSEPKEQNPEEVGDVPSHARENSLKSPENFNIEDSRNDGKLPSENEDSTNQQPPEDLDTKDSHIKEKQGQSSEKDQNNPETIPEKLEEEASPKPIASSETPYEAPLSSDNQPLFHEKDTPSLREEDAIASGNKTSTPNDSDLGTTNDKPSQTTPERINGSTMEALDKQNEDFVDSQSPKNPDAEASLVDEQKEPSRKEEVDLDQIKEATGSDDSSDLINPGQPQQNSRSKDGSPLKESDATDENKQDSESPQPPESPNTAISSDEPIKKELDKEDVAQNIEPESHSSEPDTPIESSLSPGIQNIPEDKDSQPRKEPVKSDTLSSTPDEPKASNDLKESPQPSTEPSVVPPPKDTDTTKDNQDSILPQSPTNDDTGTNPNAEEGRENPSGDLPANKEIPSKEEPEVQSSSGLPPVSALPIESSLSSPNIVSHPEEQTSESQKPAEESTDSINPKANSESKGDTPETPESQPKIKSEEHPSKNSDAATKPSEAQEEKDTGTENRSQPPPSEDGDITEPEEEKVLEEYEDNDSDNPKTQELRDTGTNKLPSPSSKNEGSNIAQPDEEKVLNEFEDDDSENPNDPTRPSKRAAKPNAEKIDDSMNNPLKNPMTNEDNSANHDSKPIETPKTPTQEEEERKSNPNDAEIKPEMKSEASDESSRPVELPASSDEPLSSLDMPPQPEEEKIDTEPKGDLNSDTRSGSEQDGSETPEPQRRVDSDEGAEKDSDAIPEPPVTREVGGTGAENESQPAPSEDGGPSTSEPEEEHIEEEQVIEQFEDSDPENPDAPTQPLKEEETPITEKDSSIGESSKQPAPNGGSTPDQDSSPKEAPKTQVQDEASSTNPTDAKIDEKPKVQEPVLSEKKAEPVHNEEDAVDPEHPQIEQEQEVLEYEDDSESDANAHPLTATKSLGPLNEEIIQPKEVEIQQKPDVEEQPEEIEHEEVIEDFVEDGSDHPSPADVGSNADESDDKIKDQDIPKEADEENKVGEPIESVNKPEESAFNNPEESSIPETAEEDPKEEASIPKQESPTVENASPASNNSMEILDEFVHETFIDDENEDLEQDKDGKLNELSDESLPQNNAVTPENQPEETKMLNAPNREDDENKMEGTSMNNDKEVPDDNEKEEILHEFDDEEEVDDAEPHEEKGSSSPESTPEAPRNSSKNENTSQSQETSDASHNLAPTKSDPMGDTAQPENPAKEVDNKSASNSDEETVLDEYSEQDQEVSTEDLEDVFSGLTGLAVLKEYVLKSLNK